MFERMLGRSGERDGITKQYKEFGRLMLTFIILVILVFI
jgi:hypothetical protein